MEEEIRCSDCHHSLRLWGDWMKIVKNIYIFLDRLPLLPGRIFGEISASTATILP